MSKSRSTRKSGQAEIERLQRRLSELEETLRAIRGGEVDALIISEGDASRVYTLQGAEHPYRVMVQAMNEGSATLTNDGVILFANPRLSEMLGMPEDQLLGKSLRDLIEHIECDNMDDLLKLIETQPTKVECTLHVVQGGSIPVYLSFSPLKENGFRGVCLIVTDLSGQKK